MMIPPRLRSSAALLLLVAQTGYTAAAEWQRFGDPIAGYSVDLPSGSFVPRNPAGEGHRTLFESSGEGIIDLYGGNNLKRLPPVRFIEQLSSSPRIADVSYTALGKTWFVISGHYKRESSDPGRLIYYAKFVFSDDLARFAAFEISYPTSEKRRMDAVVAKMEDTLRLTR